MSIAEIVILTLRTSILLIVFGLGLKAPRGVVAHLLGRPGQLLRSLVAMNVVMPLFAVALAFVFPLTPAVKVALVVLAVSPVPPILPRKQLKFAAHEPYVYGLLAIAALLAIAYVPSVMLAAGKVFAWEIRIAPSTVARIVLSTVLLPLAAGMAVRWGAPALANRAVPWASGLGTALLVAGAIPVLLVEWRAVLSLIGNGTVLAFVAFVAAGLAAGHLLGGPDPEDRNTLALATSSRHPAVALAIAGASFKTETLVPAAILLYLIINALLFIPYQRWHQRGHGGGSTSAKGEALWRHRTT